jgi:iron complex transport system ATP-binding protein
VLGQTFGETNLHELRQRVKLVQPSAPVDFAPSMTVQDVVLSGLFGTVGLFDEPNEEDRTNAKRLVDQIGLGSHVSARYGTLSTGERMRCLIARALITRPALLLLDEPTAGLDLVGRELFLSGVDRLMSSVAPKPAILLISHHLEELPRSAGHAVLMRAGRVVASGEVEAILTNEWLTETFGVEVTVTRNEGRWTCTSRSDSAWI